MRSSVPSFGMDGSEYAQASASKAALREGRLLCEFLV